MSLIATLYALEISALFVTHSTPFRVFANMMLMANKSCLVIVSPPPNRLGNKNRQYILHRTRPQHSPLRCSILTTSVLYIVRPNTWFLISTGTNSTREQSPELKRLRRKYKNTANGILTFCSIFPLCALYYAIPTFQMMPNEVIRIWFRPLIPQP